jgi:hypothetical protein
MNVRVACSMERVDETPTYREVGRQLLPCLRDVGRRSIHAVYAQVVPSGLKHCSIHKLGKRKVDCAKRRSMASV